MNGKKLSILAIALWLISAASIGSLFIFGNTVSTTDDRKAIILSETERNLILGEMRNMLSSIQEIITAVAENDMQLVEKTALSIGTAEVRNVPKTLMLKLPIGFKTMGSKNHTQFDQVAAQAKNGGKAVLIELGNLMTNCVTCHEGYSLKAE